LQMQKPPDIADGDRRKHQAASKFLRSCDAVIRGRSGVGEDRPLMLR
jgi:hypothetical protein